MTSGINVLPLILCPAAGLLMGWLATLVLRHRGFPLWANLAVGLAGGFLGIFLFPSLDHGMIGAAESLLRGSLGALIFLATSKILHREAVQ